MGLDVVEREAIAARCIEHSQDVLRQGESADGGLDCVRERRAADLHLRQLGVVARSGEQRQGLVQVDADVAHVVGIDADGIPIVRVIDAVLERVVRR